MIISASRRTDIPSYYSEWFFERLKEGYVYVRNPMNPHAISKVFLSPDVVDGIVFWTKNPVPMLGRLAELQAYPYYFQFTLNPYGPDVETRVPSKNDIVIPAFQKLSAEAGRERVVWRYDPILISETYTVPYHIKYFKVLAGRLADYTEKCTVSFLDMYRSIEKRMGMRGIRAPSPGEIEELMGNFCSIAKQYGIDIDTCAEEIDLSRFGVSHASCIDKNRLERIGNRTLAFEKDKNQRPACGCAASIDIGAYNTCGNGCIYCYANYNGKAVRGATEKYDAHSPLLCGEVLPGDTVKPREMRSCRKEAF